MIEITIVSEDNALLLLTLIIKWIINKVTTNEEYDNVEIQGYVVSVDKTRKHPVSGLILVNDEISIGTVMQILQQPPQKFKEKYEANLLCEYDDDGEEDGEAKPEKEITDETGKEHT